MNTKWLKLINDQSDPKLKQNWVKWTILVRVNDAYDKQKHTPKETSQINDLSKELRKQLRTRLLLLVLYRRVVQSVILLLTVFLSPWIWILLVKSHKKPKFKDNLNQISSYYSYNNNLYTEAKLISSCKTNLKLIDIDFTLCNWLHADQRILSCVSCAFWAAVFREACNAVSSSFAAIEAGLGAPYPVGVFVGVGGFGVFID